jgi:hypothetical protein
MNDELTTLEDLLPDEGVIGSQEQTQTQEAPQSVDLADLEARIRADERARVEAYYQSQNTPDEEESYLPDDLVTKGELKDLQARMKAEALKEIESFMAPAVLDQAINTLAVGADAEGRKALAAKLGKLDTATLRAITNEPELRELYQGYAQSKSAQRVAPPASERVNSQTAKDLGVTEAAAAQLGVLEAMFPNLDRNTLMGYVKQ